MYPRARELLLPQPAPIPLVRLRDRVRASNRHHGRGQMPVFFLVQFVCGSSMALIYLLRNRVASPSRPLPINFPGGVSVCHRHRDVGLSMRVNINAATAHRCAAPKLRNANHSPAVEQAVNDAIPDQACGNTA